MSRERYYECEGTSEQKNGLSDSVQAAVQAERRQRQTYLPVIIVIVVMSVIAMSVISGCAAIALLIA